MVILSLINKYQDINAIVREFISVILLFIYILKINTHNVLLTIGRFKLLNSEKLSALKGIKYIKWKKITLKSISFNNNITSKMLIGKKLI